MHENIFHLTPSQANLFTCIVIVILSASIWALLAHWQLQRLHSSVALLSQLQGPPSQSWFKGNYTHIFDLKQGWDFHKMLASNYGSVVKITGHLGKKQLYIFDTKAMYHILIKYVSSGAILFGKGLLSTVGEDHQKQRKILVPVFSITHVRSMIPIFYNVADQLQNALSQRVQSGPQEIDLLSWMARTALELIGQSGFGYSFDEMIDDVPKHEYSVIVKNFVPTLTQLAFARFYLLPLSIKFLPKSIRVFLMNIIPWKSLHNVRDMVNYMYELSVQVYEEKKHAFEKGDETVLKQIGKGNDLLSILMRANMKANSEDKLEENEIIAEISTFIFAAMDTTSSALARILHLFALHPEVQAKLRNELVTVQRKHGSSHLSYDSLVGLPYLDAICRETLRLYPPVSSILRENTADAIVPISQPIYCKNGNKVTEVFVPKGTTVVISILNSNRNPDLWGPDVLDWKPERWLSPLPEAILNSRLPAVYSHLMTFNGGSRSCIGFKFAQLELKVVITMLVKHFKFSLAPKKEIFWQMSGIASPVLAGDGKSKYPEHPQLPLIVELIKQET
ncbi:cytochrome P450 [Lentinula raphanica]|nr:cytochrome P450 [Lentinula raphanica]